MTALPTRLRPLRLHRSWIRLTRRADPARPAPVIALPEADERLATKSEANVLRAMHSTRVT